ncbi:MAG TPA: hypothetical protein VM285_16505, partial [Polyangia bacterium]|nr:hypothetical protein [Polyangia bacterium]
MTACFPSGAFLGGPVPAGDLPTDVQPNPPEVAIEVESIGLDGYVAGPEQPTVARLVLDNPGPARRVRVSFEEVVREPTIGIRTVMAGRVAPLDVSLEAGERREITWTVPLLNDGLVAMP